MLSVCLLVLPACASAQALVGRTDSIYTWRGSLAARGVLTIRNLNGPVEVRPGDGSAVELRAEKRTSRGGGNLQDVSFEVQSSSGGDITICSTYRGRNACDSDRADRRDRDDDEYGNRHPVTVVMTLLVPRGAQVRLSTGNGDVSVERIGGDVQATTGNGRVRVEGTDGPVRVSTGNGDVEVRGAKAPVSVRTGNGSVTVTTSEGPVDARSGNGDIDVTMSALKARDNMEFHTGSGSVRVTLPSGYNGELDASTGNGELHTDFELKLQGRMNPRHVRATIGNGGPALRLTTGNGRLEIRRGS